MFRTVILTLMLNARAFPRPITERDRRIYSCLHARLPIKELCGIIQHYAVEFQGLQYDPEYSQGYERADLWLRMGPIPVEGLCDLVAGFLESLAGDYTGPLCVLPNGAIAWGANRKVALSNGIESMTLEPEPSDVSALVAFPDGNRVGIGTQSGLVAVWNTINQTLESMPKLCLGSVRSMVVLTDGKLAVGSSAQDLVVWDVDTKRCEWRWYSLTTSFVTLFPMVAMPHGMFASGSDDSLVRLWDITHLSIKVLSGHRHQVNALALLPDGALASASSDKKVIVWDVHSGSCVRQLEGHSMPVVSLAVLSEDRLAAGSMSNHICVWDVLTGECLQRLWGPGGPVRTLAVLIDGTLASGSDDGTVEVWDPDSGECVHFIRGHSGHAITHLAVLPNGQLVSGGLDNTMRFWK